MSYTFLVSLYATVITLNQIHNFDTPCLFLSFCFGFCLHLDFFSFGRFFSFLQLLGSSENFIIICFGGFFIFYFFNLVSPHKLIYVFLIGNSLTPEICKSKDLSTPFKLMTWLRWLVRRKCNLRNILPPTST